MQALPTPARTAHRDRRTRCGRPDTRKRKRSAAGPVSEFATNLTPDARPLERPERLLAHAIRRRPPDLPGWAFLLLDDPADRELVFWQVTTPAGTESSRWLDRCGAPLLIVAHSNRDAYLDRYAEPDKGWTDRDEARWPVPYWDIDAGMASLLMLLTAVRLRAGRVLLRDSARVHDGLPRGVPVPAGTNPVGVSVGYPRATTISPARMRVARWRRWCTDHDGADFGLPPRSATPDARRWPSISDRRRRAGSPMAMAARAQAAETCSPELGHRFGATEVAERFFTTIYHDRRARSAVVTGNGRIRRLGCERTPVFEEASEAWPRRRRQIRSSICTSTPSIRCSTAPPG